MFTERKSIVIDDVKAAACDMPLEYEVLKPQNIQSLIAVPVYNNRELSGFIGVDNPDLEVSLKELQQEKSIMDVLCMEYNMDIYPPEMYNFNQ